MCPEYKILLVRDANGNLLQMFSAVILSVHCESAVYKTICLIADCFGVEVLIGT